MTTLQPIIPNPMSDVTNPAGSAYDQGIDTQPNVTWAKDGFPSKTLQSPIPPSTGVSGASNSSTLSSRFASTSSEKNVASVDLEDPSMLTKELPFAGADASEISRTVVTPAVDDLPHWIDEERYQLHNGNILDRTMDKIRNWVHSFQNNGTQQQYEYVVEEATGAVKRRRPTFANKSQGVNVQPAMSDLRQQVESLQTNVGGKVNDLQAQVGDAMHTMGDKATASVQQVKSKVNEFISSHQSHPGEPLSTTITEKMSAQLPSAEAVKAKASAFVPPLAQQASSSLALFSSFVRQYLSTNRAFLIALRRQSLPLQTLTLMVFITHLVIPLFFFDKSAARSVIYCYVTSSLLSHATFFLSGHLRFVFLAHLVFWPLLLSLWLQTGFDEASQAQRASTQYESGHNLNALLMAPMALRNYLFVLWLRSVLMIQTSLLTVDIVNVLDLLGFSLETRRGQEMQLLNNSMSHVRRTLGHPATSSLNRASMSSKPISSRPLPRRVSPDPTNEERENEISMVQSHEKPTTSSRGLRERKAVHPTYYVNSERV